MHLIFLGGKIWTHKTSFTPPLFIEVSALRQDVERSCIWVLGVSILPLSTIFIFNFRIVPNCSDSVVFFVFHFITIDD